MQTPWGDIAIRDGHLHFFSHNYFRLLTDQPPEEIAAKLVWEAPPHQPEMLAERWLAELDAQGVASAALISSIPGDEDSVAKALRVAPSRFYGYAMVNPLAPDAAERMAGALRQGFKAVCLFPAMHRYNVTDERLNAVWNSGFANIFVHCGVLSIGVRSRLGLTSEFDMRYSNPIDLHGVALRHPNLRFLIPHFGAGYFRETLMLAGMCPNVYLDTSSSNKWMRYSESPLDLDRVFRKALNVAGPRRLIFGTDASFFPRGWVKAVFEEQAASLQKLGITADDAASIFGGNLARLME